MRVFAVWRSLSRSLRGRIAGRDAAISSETLADGPTATGTALAGRECGPLLGYRLILPFEIIYLHQFRGFGTATDGLVLAAIMGSGTAPPPLQRAQRDLGHRIDRQHSHEV